MTYFRFALRAFRRSPGVFVIAIASLALGTGANIAIFSIFNQALLRPLTVPHADQLVTFESPGPRFGRTSASNAGNSNAVFSYPLLRDLRSAQTSFQGIAAHRDMGVNVSYHGSAFADTGLLVTGNYFSLLNVQAAFGRLIDDGDDRVQGEQAVAVLSYGLWQSKFGADPRMLNSTLLVNGEPLTIVGIAPRGFRGTTLEENPGVFVPLSMGARLHNGHPDPDNRNDNYLYLFARLKPGVSIEQATASTNPPFRNILASNDLPLQTNITERRRQEFLSRSLILREGSRGEQPNRKELQSVFVLLFVIAGTVLLIASCNIANLLLARAIDRSGDLAVMISLGASRSRLILQIVSEAMLTAVCGAAGGILLARWTLDALRAMMPSAASTDTYFAFTVDIRMVGFIALATLATTVVSGLLPAFHGTRLDVIASLRAQTGMPSGTRGSARFRAVLASTQVALSMGLMVVAVLFAQSLYNISRVELGMNVSHVSTFHVAPTFSGYTPGRSRLLFEQIEARLHSLPGVTAVGASTNALINGDYSSSNVTVEGFDATPDADTDSYQSRVAAGTFAALGVPLIAGREFTAQDGGDSQKVAIVNESFVKKFQLGRNAVGRRMRTGRGNGPLDIEIVGVLKDAKYGDVKDPMVPQFFTPYRQGDTGALTFYIRSLGDPAQTVRDIRQAIAGIDANLPVVNLRTMTEQVERRSAIDRLLGRLSLAFAALATLLAAIGLYGVLAFAVARRTREIGVRMALGADRRSVRGFVISHVGRLLPAGLIAGGIAALALGRLARTLLFQVDGAGGTTIISAAVGITLVALTAALVPARRASRIDPIKALRYD
jgi:predicted permease